LPWTWDLGFVGDVDRSGCGSPAGPEVARRPERCERYHEARDRRDARLGRRVLALDPTAGFSAAE